MRLRTAALSLTLFLTVPAGAEAAERIALVIGNSAYRPGYELRNPVADARAVAKSLSDLGFTVTIVMACAFAVRRAWVPGSVDRSQSQNPVSAANTETIAPPISTNDAAR